MQYGVIDFSRIISRCGTCFSVLWIDGVALVAAQCSRHGPPTKKAAASRAEPTMALTLFAMFALCGG